MALNIEQQLKRAQKLQKSGDYRKALSIYRDLLEKHPKNVSARRSLLELQQALTATQLTRNEPSIEERQTIENMLSNSDTKIALSYIDRLKENYTNSVLLHEFACRTLTIEGRYNEAKIEIDKAIRLDANNSSIRNNLGLVFANKMMFTDALDCFIQASMLDKESSQPINNISYMTQVMDDKDLAIRFYQHAISNLPSQTKLYRDAGQLLLDVGKFQDALDLLSKAVMKFPTDPYLICVLGVAQQRTGDATGSIKSFSKSIDLGGEKVTNNRNIGYAHIHLWDFEKSLKAFKKALRDSPEDISATFGYCYAKSHLCDWSLSSFNIGKFTNEELTTTLLSPFMAIALEDDPERHLIRNKKYAIDMMPRVQRPDFSVENNPEKIKIGYFTSDCHNHATLQLMIQMFELHSDKFEIHVFSYDKEPADEMTRRLVSSVDYYYDVSSFSDGHIAKTARDKGIHIAIDLKGYTANTRSNIFAFYPAPIQINYLGYPGTMGTNIMDYIIADNSLVPVEHREFYSEKVIYMPDTYQINSQNRPVPKPEFSKQHYGLPEDSFVFCCMNNNYKITPVEFDIWMRLLEQTPNSVLWLFMANNLVKKNLIEEAKNRGINEDRLVFADKVNTKEHLDRQCYADLFLDTFICNAHTTMSDALWAGVPAITLQGNSFASRVASSLLSAVDLGELITNSYDEYEKLALELANNHEKLSRIKHHLLDKRYSHALFDTRRFTNNIEEAYLQAWRQYANHKPTTHIYVGSSSDINEETTLGNTSFSLDL